ncbi:transglutaminase TgpA family protein, partial [Micromonospora echinofusca]
AIYSVPVAVYVDSVPPVPFVIGAAGFLWLLVADNVERVRRFGRRFTGDGRDVDVWEPSPLASAGRRLAVIGVAIAVALPLAVPGMTGGLLDRFTSGSGDGTGGSGAGGTSGEIDLFAALSGQLTQSETTDMVRVTTAEPSPFYLRFGVADELRPDGFRVRNPSGAAVNRGLPEPEPVPGGVTRRQYQAEVEITRDLNMRLLPVYDQPVRIRGLDGNWLYDQELDVVFAKRGTSRGKKYSFDYVRSTYSPEVLRAARPLSADASVLAEQTTRPIVPAVENRVRELIAGRTTDYDRVRAIYDFFSAKNGFRYQLSTERGTSGQEIVDFLENRVGFCQQYAAAMAWLVRAAGIPARVAFGFTNGSGRQGDTYTLTNRNLHAWTEVFFNGIGWVPFDATPADSVVGSARSAWAPNADAPDPVPSSTATTTPGGVPASAGPDGPDAADRELDADLNTAAGTGGPASPNWPWWLLGVVLLAGLLAVPALRRAALRRSRQPHRVGATGGGTSVRATPGPGGSVTGLVVLDPDLQQARADAHAAWAELLDTLVDFRIPVDRTETPRATADRLVRQGLDEPAAEAARLLGRAEERARYAREPLTGGQLPPALRSVRRALAAEADRRTRVLAAVLPPSVLLHWRTWVGDTSSRVVAAVGRLRTAMLRWNPRRLLANRPAR